MICIHAFHTNIKIPLYNVNRIFLRFSMILVLLLSDRNTLYNTKAV